MTDIDKLIELQALITEREAMVEENETRKRQGYAHAWPASCFTELAEAMRALKTVEAKPEQQPIAQVKATNEHHWYCPSCERSCLSRIAQSGEKVWLVTCSSCGEKYSVVSEKLPTSENVECANLHLTTEQAQNLQS